MVYPLPKRLVKELLASVDEIVVVEEVVPWSYAVDVYARSGAFLEPI